MLKTRYILALILGLMACTLQAEPKDQKPASDRRLDAQHYMEIMGATIRTLQLHYVDSIDWAKVLTAGINAICQELDPYTQFYTEESQEEFKTMTTGEYAGIGSIIQQRGDTVVVSQPYENMPAAEVGLWVGDRILKIDGESMVGKTTSQVSDRLRGQPNTEFDLTILRPYESEPIVKHITRRKIVMEAVPYFGWTNDSIGYINLTQFTDKAAIGVQNAIESFRKDNTHSLKGLILDLRGNPGGLLDEAVKIVGMFVPKGSMVVETRGRGNEHSVYRTNTQPVEPNVPLVLMIDRSSASASEILSGALQDMDRAVVLGERSFGKGLVQSSRPLPYNTIVKYTSSKYYIPSGRCIQAIDYQARRMARWEAGHGNDNEDLGRIPDSLTHVFYTANGRQVRDGGGIKPDVEKKAEMLSTLTAYLERQNVIFDYCTRFRHENAEMRSLTDEDYQQFCQLAKATKQDTILSLLHISLAHDLDSLRTEVTEQIEQELALRYHYQRGQISQALKSDKWTLEATAILTDKSRYTNLLSKPEPVADTKSKTKSNKKSKSKPKNKK